MAIIQALLGLITRSAGKILNAMFGWAVRALFGNTSPSEKTLLSGVVAAAAAWPLLLVGLIAPKVATLLLTFVPLPESTPSWMVRLVWLGLVLLVPVAVGVVMASKAPKHAKKQSTLKRLLSGFPITLGLATTFLLMFVTVPLMRLWAALRGQKSAEIPLITDAAAYHEMARQTVNVLNENGFGLRPAEPGWWVAAPVRVLRFFGGEAFGAFVPEKLEFYKGSNLEVSFYPSGVTLRGKGQKLTWAHGLVVEATARGKAYQTTSAAAQDLEKQIRRLWGIYEEEPQAHRDSVRLLTRVKEITRDLGEVDIDFDDWQIIYRQLLQLQRALHGNRQLLEKEARDNSAGRSQDTKQDGPGKQGSQNTQKTRNTIDSNISASRNSDQGARH